MRPAPLPESRRTAGERARAWALQSIERLGIRGEIGIFEFTPGGGGLRMTGAVGMVPISAILPADERWINLCRVGRPAWPRADGGAGSAVIPLVTEGACHGLCVIYLPAVEGEPLGAKTKRALVRITTRLSRALAIAGAGAEGRRRRGPESDQVSA